MFIHFHCIYIPHVYSVMKQKDDGKKTDLFAYEYVIADAVVIIILLCAVKNILIYRLFLSK